MPKQRRAEQPKRDRAIGIRVTAQEHAEVSRLAEAAHMSITDFLLSAVLDREDDQDTIEDILKRLSRLEEMAGL